MDNGKTAFWEAIQTEEDKNVILLHGFTRNSGRMNRRAKIYWERGYNVYFVDNRGHGRSKSSLWPPTAVIAAALDGRQSPLTRRPATAVSLAVSYQLSGSEPWAYHLGNLFLHLTSSLLLFTLIRRTSALALHRMTWGDAGWLAFWTTAIWQVHPLQTQSVTWMVQRSELLAGCMALLSLYLAVRGFSSPGRRTWLWYLACLAACAIGMAAKESGAVCPILICLYDVVFVAGSVRYALRLRPFLYWGLLMTWTIPAGLLLSTWGDARIDFVGDRSPLTYAITQSEVVLYYLRLALWPFPIVNHYGWTFAEHWTEVVPSVVVVLSVVVLTVLALSRRRWYGYAGAWFFLTLAPTSSFVALSYNVGAHRMYLPSAAVAFAAVFLVSLAANHHGPHRGRARTLATVLLGVVTMTLAIATYQRNTLFSDPILYWEDNIAKRPTSSVAHASLGVFLYREHLELDRAAYHFRRSLQIQPGIQYCHYFLGVIALDQGMPVKAQAQLQHAISLSPLDALAHHALGLAFAQQHRFEEARTSLEHSRALNPRDPMCHYHLGMVYVDLGLTDMAAVSLRRAIELRGDLTQARAAQAALSAGGPADSE